MSPLQNGPEVGGGTRRSPESFSRATWDSTWARARMVASRSTGLPSWLVEKSQ